MVEFTWQSEAPSKSCLYPAGAYVQAQEGIGQHPQLLKVLQTVPEGFLVQHPVQVCIFNGGCHEKENPNILFVRRTSEENVVDGSFLDKPNDGALYEYAGTFTYPALVGSKTVHSFRKIPAGTLKKAVEGFKTYDINQEFLAEFGAWGELEKLSPGSRAQMK